MPRVFKLAVLCGGPSLERGISLNSARSVCDHLGSEAVEIIPVYYNTDLHAYHISPAQLYSNTPSDFDFKLRKTGTPLDETALVSLLQSCDLTFPAIHGVFGEDGQIQSFLEKHKISFIGSGEQCCGSHFNKYELNQFLKNIELFTLDTLSIVPSDDISATVERFFKTHQYTERFIVKPAISGSSIGVYSVQSPEVAIQKIMHIFDEKIDTQVVIQPFAQGSEFTITVIENHDGQPVAMIPTDIQIDYSNNEIFDYEKKYLAVQPNRKYYCPPHFDEKTVEIIQRQAEYIFTKSGASDMIRLDGWILDEGEIWFADFNPISGMEQNSFLFNQTALLGMSHSDTLHFILKSACLRAGIVPPVLAAHAAHHKKPVHVFFGGKTAERQVSVMSGTNSWLKLLKSNIYNPQSYFLDKNHLVWKIPYALNLHHTVEEISEAISHVTQNFDRLQSEVHHVKAKLSQDPRVYSQVLFIPTAISIDECLEDCSFAFIGLHGGIGENGVFQRILERRGIPFNGCDSHAAHLCMNKYKSGELLSGLAKQGIHVAGKKLLPTQGIQFIDPDTLWQETTTTLQSPTLIVKPNDDGCSAGILRLFTAQDLAKYLHYIEIEQRYIPAGTFTNQHAMVEMPSHTPRELLFEEFIETDNVKIVQGKIQWEIKTDWVEVTVGVIGIKGSMQALSPSMTIAEGEVLTVAEKFQGGTGVNITPPPEQYISAEVTQKVQKRIAIAANTLGISGYSRIDAFMHIKTGEIYFIEANTLPALTPSTVIFHQALEQTTPQYPTEFLERLVTQEI